MPKLEERLTDLTEQGIFFPQMVLIDGLPFDRDVRPTLAELKALGQKLGIHFWFTVKTHRHEEPGPDGLPAQLRPVADLFEIAVLLQPEGKKIYIKLLRGKQINDGKLNLLLDPATMLIEDGS